MIPCIKRIYNGEEQYADHEYFYNEYGQAECQNCGLLRSIIEATPEIKKEKPSEAIRRIYDARRKAKTKGKVDEYDMLFGGVDTLHKSIIQHLDETII